MKVPKDYQAIQTSRSSTSRGIKWGKRAKESVDRYLSLFKGKILEVGCNDGLAMEHMQGYRLEVEGIDIAKHKLEIANSLIKKRCPLKINHLIQSFLPTH